MLLQSKTSLPGAKRLKLAFSPREKLVSLRSQMRWSTKFSQPVGGWDASRGLLRQETLSNRVLMERFSSS